MNQLYRAARATLLSSMIQDGVATQKQGPLGLLVVLVFSRGVHRGMSRGDGHWSGQASRRKRLGRSAEGSCASVDWWTDRAENGQNGAFFSQAIEPNSRRRVLREDADLPAHASLNF